MITGVLQGVLGNQLFILFTTIAYAIQNKHPVLFQYNKQLTNGGVKYTYWDTFLSAINDLTTNTIITNDIKHKFTQIREYKEGQYNELPKITLNESAILYGYFQSFRYFQNEYYEISRMIGIYDLRYKYNNWFLKNGLNKLTTISMHFCISDYNNLNIVLPFEYYKNSLQFILNDTNILNMTILYFCEKRDLIEVERNISILQNTFTSCNFKYCNLESVITEKMCNISADNNNNDSLNQIVGNSNDEIIIMGNCKYNIIANNTFSWWAAYIGYMEDLPYLEHIVCYPSNNNSDLYPKSWNKI